MQLASASIVVLIGLLCAIGGQAKKDNKLMFDTKVAHKEGFDKIDKHLSESVASDDIDANMNEAASWLKKLEQKEKRGSGFIKFGSSSSPKLMEALQLLLLLKTDQCNDEAHEVVDACHRAVGFPRVHSGKPPVRRIEKIVYHYARKYYDTCYPDNLGTKIDLLKPETRDVVMKLANIMLYPAQCGDKKDVRHYAQILRNHLKRDPEHLKLVAEQAKGMKEFDRDDYTKYFVNPCKELEQTMAGESHERLGKEFPLFDLEPSIDADIFRRRVAAEHCLYIVENEDDIWSYLSTKL